MTTACQILTSNAEIEGIASEWRALHRELSGGIFTDYDWFRIWWETVGQFPGRTLHIVIARENGRLVGLLPLVVTLRKGFRVLQAIGAEAFYYCDLLAGNSDIAADLWKAAKQSSHYDFAHIRDVAPESLCEQALSTFATLHDNVKTLLLRLEWKTPDDWQATFSDNFRKNNAKALRQLSKLGEVKYEIVRSEPVPQHVIEAMVKNKTAWCNEQGLQGMFDQPNILEYYKRMAVMAAQNGTLVLGSLHCGGSSLAQHIMFANGKTLHSYVLGTDAEWNKYSPGNLAHIYAISWAIEQGFEWFDHMQGDFAYKYKFAGTERFNKEFSFHRGIKGWFGELLFFGKRKLKRARPS